MSVNRSSIDGSDLLVKNEVRAMRQDEAVYELADDFNPDRNQNRIQGLAVLTFVIGGAIYGAVIEVPAGVRWLPILICAAFGMVIGLMLSGAVLAFVRPPKREITVKQFRAIVRNRHRIRTVSLLIFVLASATLILRLPPGRDIDEITILAGVLFVCGCAASRWPPPTLRCPTCGGSSIASIDGPIFCKSCDAVLE